MSDEPENLVLVYLRRMDAKFDRLLDEVAEMKRRQNDTHSAILALRRDQVADSEAVAHVEARMDRFGERLERVERRLDIRDDPRV